jgi:hypothetical protein
MDPSIQTRRPMTITIDLGPEEERKLFERASRRGQDVTAYIHGLIARDIQGVDAALASFCRQIEESGMSDSELADFFEEIREEVWQEKYGKPNKAS